MSNEFLTIAIPTYNRNDKLVRTIKALLKQITSNIKIKVFDNCSDIPVVETLRENGCINEQIEVFSNSVNIGMSGNFIKCFESCDTEWLWVLGDDDPPYPNALQVIEEVITANRDTSFINFKCILAKNRTVDFMASSQDELINRLDSFGNFLYISMCVYNMHKMQNGYRALYQYGYTFAPHTAFVFSAIYKNNNFKHRYLFSSREIIDTDSRDTKQEETWNWLGLSLVIFLLYELAFDVSNENKKKWLWHLRTHIIGPKQVYSEICKLDPLLLNYSRNVYWYDQVFLRSNIAMKKGEWFDYVYYRLRLYVKKKFTSNRISHYASDSHKVYERF